MAVYTQTIRTDTADSVPNLRAMEGQSRRTADAMEQTAKSAKKVEDRTDQLGTRAGKTASAMGMLGGVLGRIDPALEDAARGVADVADSLDAATMFGSSLFRILGPVGVAATALGGAYLYLKTQLDNANAAMEESAQQATSMVQLHEAVRDAALRRALAEGQLTQEQYNQAIATRTASEAFEEQRRGARESLDLLDEQIARQNEILQQRTEQIERNARLIDDESMLANANRGNIIEMEGAARALVDLNNQRTIAANQLEVLTAAENRYAEDLSVVAEQQHSVTTRMKEGTEAIKTMTEEVMTLQQAFQSLGLGAAGGVGIGIDLADPMSAQLGPMRERLELLAKQIEIRQRLQNLPPVDGGAAGPSLLQGAQGAAQAGMSLITGNLAALGPVGAALSGLATIGQMGAEGVEERLEDLQDSIIEGVQALPRILIEIIPEFVSALVTELPIAIARALFEVIQVIIEGVRGTGEPVTAESILDRPFGIFQLGLAIGGDEKGVTAADQIAAQRSRSANAATRGRLVRADGAQRLAMSRAPTSTMFGQGATVIQQALGFDSGTQDRFQRRFSQLIDADTGLRGRT